MFHSFNERKVKESKTGIREIESMVSMGMVSMESMEGMTVTLENK